MRALRQPTLRLRERIKTMNHDNKAMLKKYYVDDDGRRFFRLVGTVNGEVVSIPLLSHATVHSSDVDIGSIVLTVSEDDPTSVQAHRVIGATVAGWVSLSDADVEYVGQRTDDAGVVHYQVRIAGVVREYRNASTIG